MTDWLDAIANRANAGRETVERVHGTFGVLASPSLPTPTSMYLRKVQFAGTKQLSGGHEPFVFDWSLGPGVWGVITDDANLRGKSTVLEVIRWAVRGRSRLQPDVRAWLRTIDVEFELGDAGYRIHIDTDGQSTSGQILTAGGQPLAAFESDAEFEAAVEDFMLTRLGLQRLAFFQRDPGSDAGSRQSQGWPALSEALYIHSTDALLGETVLAGLPGRLLQVYLGIPWSSTLAAARAAKDELEGRSRARSRRTTPIKHDDATTGALRSQLVALESMYATTTDPAEQLARRDVALQELEKADQSWLELRDRHAGASADYEAAREAELDDERRLLDARETGELRRFFNGVDPKACPRCDVAVASGRKRREASAGTCSLCGEGTSHDEGPSAIQEIELSLSRIRAARADAEEAVKAAKRELDQATFQLDIARSAARSATESVDDAERRRIEIEIARIGGRLEAMDTPAAGVVGEDAEELHVLRATVSELEALVGASQQDLFASLNAAVLDLSRKFGILNIEEVGLDRAGRLWLRKGGTRVWYSALTGGEQLRVKIAVVMALLRIGREQGIGRHPGLLLIDAPGGHETSDADVRSILGALQLLARELTSMQVIVATARGEAARDHLPSEQRREPDNSGYLW